MATTKTFLSTLAVVAVLSTVAALAWPDRPADASEPPATVTGDVVPAAADGDVIPTVTVEAPLQVLSEESLDETQRQNSIALPSGQRLPALNGCVNTAHLKMGGFSKSPVKRLVHGRVYDYYEHEDGSGTTTRNVIDPNTGKPAAAGMHWRSIDTAPQFEANTSDEYRLDRALKRPARPGRAR